MIEVCKESKIIKVDELTIDKMKDICNRMWSGDKIVIVRDGNQVSIDSIVVDEDNGYVYINT